MSNTITAYFKGRVGVAESVYQNDYGMVINFDSIDLPAHFDCYFSILNQDEAVPGVGADRQVVIPNSVLSNPGLVTIHIPVHTGANDSEVEYVVYFKVIGRARPIDDGTPTQMTAIEQALALLQNPIGNIEQIVNEALSFTGDTFDEMQAALDADQAAFKTEVRGDIADVESDFDNLDAQFQTAVAAVTTDTEVTNIRVGEDNFTYTTAGESVRKQFSNVKGEFNDAFYTSPVNRFNASAITEGEKITGTGYVEGFYPTQADASWYTSDYIAVNEGDVVRFNKVRRCLGYTADDAQSATESLVWESSLSESNITIPSTIKYIRFGALLTELSDTMVTINADMPSSFVPYGRMYVKKLKADMLPDDGIYNYDNIALSKEAIFTEDNLTVFGQASYSNKTVTITGTNGGVQTPMFESDKRVEVHLKTTSAISLSSLRVQLGYIDSHGDTFYTVMGRMLQGSNEIIVPIDLPYYSVYEDAQSFCIVLNTGDASGSFTISDFYVRFCSEIEQVSFYADDFPSMMLNLDEVLNESEEASRNDAVFLANGNGIKYKLQISNNGSVVLVPVVPNKVLFTGNSLLRGFHDETNDTYFGMCATDAEHDYFYYAKQAILLQNPTAVISKSSCVGLEQAENTAAQESWVNGQIDAGYINSDLDLIVMQIGDNVNNAARLTAFENGFGSIISTIRNIAVKARLILIGSWFVSDNRVLTTLKAVANKYGCEFINISALNTVPNQATSGQTVTWSDGTSEVVPDAYITHPGNGGFTAIADLIIGKLNM